MGGWHKISRKHLSAYFREMASRFNRRGDDEIFLHTLGHMVMTPDFLRYFHNSVFDDHLRIPCESDSFGHLCESPGVKRIVHSSVQGIRGWRIHCLVCMRPAFCIGGGAPYEAATWGNDVAATPASLTTIHVAVQ
jgi:hypothetical protein